MFNPFPGLRPFRSDEDHLFFGREEQTAELLSLLRVNRFTAVVGTSGSGKSSLVRAGVLPELLGGMMTAAGSAWEVAFMRPGGQPIDNLARALCDADLYDGDDPDSIPQLAATLGHSGLGLIEAARQSNLDPDAKLLIVVDQFEELFRYRVTGGTAHDEAADFVNLLIQAARQDTVPIYVMLTMRSDYLGECSNFRGLAEMVNDGEYLIPQLSRDQLQRTIEGPVKVSGGSISFRLVQELLNNVSNEQDQLPVLQHALMRSFDACYSSPAGAQAGMDLEHYRSVGGMAEALSLHADEIYNSFDESEQEIVRQIFQALTERGPDNRGIRRPTRFATLCEITATDPAHLSRLIQPFRKPGCTFLMPPEDHGELQPETVVDISHESLMRVWVNLKFWVDEESQSARIYTRLAESARLYADGKAGLISDPELAIAKAWRRTSNPNQAWATRYDPAFDEAMSFLDQSDKAKVDQEREREIARQRELNQARELADVRLRSTKRLRTLLVAVAAVAVLAVGATISALRSNEIATAAREQATRQLYIADMNLAAQAWEDGNIEHLRDKLEKHLPDPGGPDYRGFEWYHWWRASNLATGQIAQVLDGAYHKAILSPDGNQVTVSVDFGGLETYDSATLALENLSLNPHWSSDIAHNPAGTHVAFADQSNAVWLQNVETLRIDMTIQDPVRGHTLTPGKEGDVPGPVKLALSPTGPLLVSGDWAGRVIFWEDGSSQRADIDGEVQAIEFTPDGKHVLVAMGRTDPHKTIHAPASGIAVLETSSRQILQIIPQPQTVHDVAVSGDGTAVASGGDDTVVRLWRMTPEGLMPRAEIEVDQPITSVAFSPDNTRLAVGTRGRNLVSIWDVRNSPRHLATLKGHSNEIKDVLFVGDSDTLWSIGGEGLIRTWDLRQATPFLEIPGDATPMNNQRAASTLFYRDDGRKIAVRSQTGSLASWEIDSGEARLSGSTSEVFLTVVSNRDGTINAGVTNKGWLQIFDEKLTPLHPEFQIGDPTDQVSETCAASLGRPACLSGLAISDDGKKVAWSILHGLINQSLSDDSSEGFFIKDTETGETSHFPVVATDLLFSPDGKKLAVGGWSSTHVWDLSPVSPQHQYRLQGWASESAPAFSHDGKLLAVGSQNQTIRIHSAATGELLSTLRGHRASVTAVAFAPDSQTLISGSRDNTVRIWDIPVAQSRTTLKGHSTNVVQVAFAPDGSSIASTEADGTTRIWLAATRQAGEEQVDFILDGSYPSHEDRLSALEEAAARFPDDPRIYRALASALAVSGRLSEAAQYFSRTDGSGEPDIRWLTYKTSLLSSLGDWEALIKSTTQLVQTDDPDPEPLLARAHAFHRAGRTEEALRDAAEALALRRTEHTAEKIQRSLQVEALVSTAQLDPAPYGIRMYDDIAPDRGLADGSPVPVSWYYTSEPPDENWFRLDADIEEQWQKGTMPFIIGNDSTRLWGRTIGTPWPQAGQDIWVRHTFELNEIPDGPLHIQFRTGGQISVYINGTHAASARVRGGSTYDTAAVSAEVTLRIGKNVMAVKADRSLWPFLDIGLYRKLTIPQLEALLHRDRP
jgi:WD40 repeat protein